MPTALILNLPEAGHMNATYPLVRELTSRGERVVYYASEAFRGPLEAAGAEFAAYPEPFAPPVHKGGLYSVMAFLMGYGQKVLPWLLAHIEREQPDYLIVDSMCVWGNLIAQITKIPAVMMASVFVPNPETVTVDEMLERAYGRAPKEMLLEGIDALNTYLMTAQAIDKQYRTESPDIVHFFANRQSQNIVFTSREFHFAGETYGPDYHFVGPSVAPRGADDLSLYPTGDGPLVYISLGTIFNQQEQFYRSCLEAFGNTSWRVILSTGMKIGPKSLGAAPPNFSVRQFVPQLAVLERASIFITHAGMNSTNEALWNGVPLLMFPQHGDQHMVAARVSELGAGLTLPRNADAQTLKQFAERVFNEPSFRNAARHIGEGLRAAGGCARAADQILAIARKEPEPCLQSV